MALLIAEFCSYDHHSPLARQVPSFYGSCVSVECLVTWSHTYKPKFPANPVNTLEVYTEVPASADDSLFKVSRAMKLGPDLHDRQEK